MAIKPDPVIGSTSEATYRCPGCGETVDSRRMDQVLHHHRHVLEPQFPPAWFNAVRPSSRTASNAETKTKLTQAPAQRARTSASAEAQRRRYGH